MTLRISEEELERRAYIAGYIALGLLAFKALKEDRDEQRA